MSSEIDALLNGADEYETSTGGNHKTRLAMTHTGDLVLQHAVEFHSYKDGKCVAGGVRWETVEIVQLDEDGNDVEGEGIPSLHAAIFGEPFDAANLVDPHAE